MIRGAAHSTYRVSVAREHAIDLRVLRQRAQGRFGIGQCVEGVMERRGERRRGVEYAAERVPVDRVAARPSDDQAVDPESVERGRRVDERSTLVIRPARESVALADHHAQRQIDLALNAPHQFERRRESAAIQLAHHLEAVRTSARRLDGVLDRRHDHFESQSHDDSGRARSSATTRSRASTASYAGVISLVEAFHFTDRPPRSAALVMCEVRAA